MPVTSAFDKEIDNTTCLLYPEDVFEPIITCGSQEGVRCLQIYLAAIGCAAILVPTVFFVVMRQLFKRDTLAVKFVWWKEHRELFRFLLNAPRAMVMLVIFIIGFGRINIKYIFSGTCRNDDFDKTKDRYLLLGMGFCAMFMPLSKCVWEVTFFTRREATEMSFSRMEEWRRKLIFPCMDVFLTLTPLLGALLFPEGYQAPEEQGRTCLRGWGCEVVGYIPALLALGSIIFMAVIAVPGLVYWFGEKGGKLRRFIHWIFILATPVWLTWFSWCSYNIVMSKSDSYRQLGYFAGFTMQGIKDPRNFSFVPAFAVANAVLDIPCYLLFGVVAWLTYTSDRTVAGGSRRVGPRSIKPNAYNSPTRRAAGARSPGLSSPAKSVASGSSLAKVHPDLEDQTVLNLY